jgi:ADP-sugar diphosphatase
MHRRIGFVFIRGAAVAVLLKLNGKLLLTRQYRVPAGKFMLECPAGMVDEDKNFMGVVAKELQEECGITLTHNELRELGSILPSAGGCDEILHLFYAEKQMDEARFQELLSKNHGDSHESIQLVIQDFTWENILAT